MGLFGGKPETKPSPAPSRPDAQPHKASAPVRPVEAATVVGAQAIIKGELTSTNDILVEGRVEGTIDGKKLVTIGETGWVKAKLIADVISVRGEVNGDCEARKKVEITSSGKVFGNITAETIVVAEGATFRGSSKMTKVAATTKAPQAPVTTPPVASPQATKPEGH